MSREPSNIVEKPPCFADLSGQVAVVTGGGSGIGRGIAQRLAAEGMKVAICGRNEDRLTETVRLIEAAGSTAAARVCDVSQPDSVAQLIAFVAEALGPADALVHNAMNMRFARLDELSLELWEETFATACRGGYLLVKQVAPVMAARGRGGIVFISSVGAQRAHLPGLPYDAAKAAQEAMTRALAIELGPSGVRVNAIAPGRIPPSRPDMTEEALHHPHVPLRRCGTPAEIGAVAAYLLSDQSSYITGQTICVDGGLTAQLSPPGIWV